MKLKKPLPPGRNYEQVRNHYEVEKSIATRLKQSSREERRILYQTMYDELFEKVPDHSRLTRRERKDLSSVANKSKFAMVDGFINKTTMFVEFAPGDCNFAMEMCKHVNFVYAIDISDQRAKLTNTAKNFRLIIYDGYHLNMNESSYDVVFSDQLIEHIHPDDIVDHFLLVKRLLGEFGHYIFRTPHAFSGPHDISGYFCDVPEGFHLKEYTYTELSRILRKLQYSSWRCYVQAKRIRIRIPFLYFFFIEGLIKIFSHKYRRILSRYLLRDIWMVAIK